jgi:hypothetical protein
MSLQPDLDRAAADALPALSPAAGRYRNLVVWSGMAVLITSAASWESPDLIKYLTFSLVALIVAAGRATSPSGAVSLSASLLLVLFGVAELTLPETVFLAASSTLLPALWNRIRGGSSTHIAFDTALATTSAAVACRIFELEAWATTGLPDIARLITAALVLFLIEITPRTA